MKRKMIIAPLFVVLSILCIVSILLAHTITAVPNSFPSSAFEDDFDEHQVGYVPTQGEGTWSYTTLTATSTEASINVNMPLAEWWSSEIQCPAGWHHVSPDGDHHNPTSQSVQEHVYSFEETE